MLDVCRGPVEGRIAYPVLNRTFTEVNDHTVIHPTQPAVSPKYKGKLDRIAQVVRGRRILHITLYPRFDRGAERAIQRESSTGRPESARFLSC